MTGAPRGRTDGIELLDRALAYTRGALAGVSDDLLDRPTPCAGWRLGDLLVHMEDSLDAFGEAARGSVALRPGDRDPRAAARVDRLQQKACALLGAWSRPVPSVVRVGDLTLDVDVVARAAALEITVHGWDLARAIGLGSPLPADLARRLLPVAAGCVNGADRGVVFGAALAFEPGASHSERLLAFLGRREVLQGSPQ